MFDFNKFKTEKIAVNVETQEEYDEFMQMCEDEGLVWYSGDKPTIQNYFHVDTHDTCIIRFSVYSIIQYSPCEFYEEQGYQITKFKDIKEKTYD